MYGIPQQAAFIGGLGGVELVLIAGVIVLLFGASKIPKLARSVGEAQGEFKKARTEYEEEIEDAVNGDNK